MSRETDTTNDIAMLKLDRGSDDVSCDLLEAGRGSDSHVQTRAQFEHKVPRMIEEV